MNAEFEKVLKAEKVIRTSKPRVLMVASLFFVGVPVFLSAAGVTTKSVDSGVVFLGGCVALAAVSYFAGINQKQAKLNLEIVKAINDLKAITTSESDTSNSES